MLKDRKGFTLAELLIVIAIIAAMVSILTVIYGNVLERSREATDISNVRGAVVEIVNHYVTSQEILTKTIPVEQKQEGWQTDPVPVIHVTGTGEGTYSFPAKTSGEYTVTIEVTPGTEALIPKVS